MTDDDDPIKAAVEQSLREQITAWWQLDGELAHRSRDYGRGVAQATRDILAALDGEESH